MQSSLPVSVDMMPAGPPANASTAKTRQDDIFATHFETASQRQANNTPQAKTEKTQGNTLSQGKRFDTENVTPAQPKEVQDTTKETSNDHAGNTTAPGYNIASQLKEVLNSTETGNETTGKTTAPGYNIAAQLKEVLNSRETGNETTGKTTAPGYNLAAQLKEILLNAKEMGNDNAGNTTATDDTTDTGQSLDYSTSDTTLNGSAGAANAGSILLHWTGADIGFTPNDQAIAKTQNNESIMARMLEAITSAANGTTGAPPTNSAVQTLASETKQSQVPTTQPIASLDSTEAITVPNVGSDGKNGIAQKDNSSLQSQISVTFVSDASPTGEASSLTDKTPFTSSSVTAQTQPAVPQPPAQQSSEQRGVDQVVQNKYGQILTIHQSSETQEMAATTTTDSKPLAPITNGKNIDASNNFIQSHLANDAVPKPPEKENGSQQQETAKDNQQKGTNSAPKNITNTQFQPELLTPQTSQLTVGPENQPLLGSHQQVNTPLSTPLAASSPLRLPSGLMVPGETVVDQMISHFSVNNRLESGTVNLKLHPQELGELRMEIKITQDTIKAHFIAQTPHAQEMITQHMPRLREALEQQGLHLQQIEVTIAANDSFSRDQFQGNAGQQQLNQSMHHTRGSQPIFTLDMGEETQEATPLANNLSVMA